jgi:hypothetical protein
MIRSLQRSWNSRNSLNWERVFCHPEAIRCSSQLIIVKASPLSGAPLPAMLNGGTLNTGLLRMVPAMASPLGTGTVVASLPQQPLLPSFSWPWGSTEQAFCVVGNDANCNDADNASLERHLFEVLDELGVMIGCPDASCTITGGGNTNSGDSSGSSPNVCCADIDDVCPA